MSAEHSTTPGGPAQKAPISGRSAGDAWLFRPVPRPGARVRLFCFAHAGGGASAYRTWPADVPDDVEICAVQLPGREGRLREAPFTRIPALVESAVAALQPHFDRPFALFGHSMGALVAFEVATALVARRGATPLHLFVSGHRAPHLPRRHPPLAHLPHDAFVAEVRSRYDGIPDEVFHMPELMELLVPTLRADMEAIEHYTHAESPPLACPITAYGGADDAQATEAEIAAWRQYTASRFRHQSFPGAHFFVQTCRASLAADIVSALGSPAHGASGSARRSAE